MKVSELNNASMSEAADFIRNFFRVFVIPSNGKIPTDKYKRYLDGKPVELEFHNHWTRNDYFKNGITAICGLMNYDNSQICFIGIDLDNYPAIQKFEQHMGMTLQKLADSGEVLVDQTDDKTRAHVYIHATRAFKYLDKTAYRNIIDPNVPIIEVKRIITIAPTPYDNGSRRQFLNDSKSMTRFVNDLTSLDYVEDCINEIVSGYGVVYLNGKAKKNTAKTPIDDDEIFYEGSRHVKLYAYACRQFRIHHHDMHAEQVTGLINAKNKKDCRPSLDDRDVAVICKNAQKFIDEEITKEQRVENEEHLLNQTVTKEDINFVINTMAKEAKHDVISIKQLFHGYNSGFTKTVIHGNLNSKNAGAGKSYLLNKVSEYYPDKYVLILTGASDKAFQHKEGIMVLEDKNTGELTEVEPVVNELRLEIAELDLKIEEEKLKPNQSKDRSLIKDLKKQRLHKEEQIKSMQENQVKLINLANTIILLLDTPQDAVTDNLMSVLSNDTTRDQKYLFTDKTTSGKISAKYNILRGTPVMFTTRVIDDTRSVRFEEKNRRFVNITPNVSLQKIGDANTLMWEECGLAPEEYDYSVVSRQDKEKSKKIVSILVAKLKNHSKYLGPKEFGVKVPFLYSINIPHNDVWSMTANDRMRRYLTIITKENMDSRPRLVRRDNPNKFLPISTFEDLKETLELMKIGGSNIRPYIAEWYNDVFLKAFKDENGLIKDDPVTNEKENYVSVTTTQLKTKTLEIKGISISNEDLRHKYLDPLINQGIIDKSRSEIRKNENVFWPVNANGHNIFSLFTTEGDAKLNVSNAKYYPTKELIRKSFSFGEDSKNGKNEREKSSEIIGDKQDSNSKKNLLDIYRLEDNDGTELTLDQLIDKYFSDPKTCFLEQKIC